MCNYTFFSKDHSQWGECYQLLWGCHSIFPLLEQFQVTQVTQPELSFLSCSGVWGDTKKFCRDLVFLLISPKKAIAGEMVFGHAMVWIHPYQACISTLDEAAKKLTLVITSSENWAYAFVWFNKDAQHIPFPKEGHLSAMIEGAPSRVTCGHLCQLEVHLLLQLECQVVYPEGLNGSPGAGSNISTRITCPWGEYA